MNQVVMINKTPYEMSFEEKAVYDIVSNELLHIMLRKDFNRNTASQQEKEAYEGARASILDHSLLLSRNIILAIEKARKEKKNGN